MHTHPEIHITGKQIFLNKCEQDLRKVGTSHKTLIFTTFQTVTMLWPSEPLASR